LAQKFECENEALEAENAALKFELRHILEDYGLTAWDRTNALALLKGEDK
jgi:hypothetical protein